jgi:hypothetical protein
MSFDLSSMERGELWRDRYMGLLLSEYVQDVGAGKPNTKTRDTSIVLKEPSHSSKPQQKEARTGRYLEKQASDFAKYPIMGQTLKCGV